MPVLVIVCNSMHAQLKWLHVVQCRLIMDWSVVGLFAVKPTLRVYIISSLKWAGNLFQRMIDSGVSGLLVLLLKPSELK